MKRHLGLKHTPVAGVSLTVHYRHPRTVGAASSEEPPYELPVIPDAFETDGTPVPKTGCIGVSHVLLWTFIAAVLLAIGIAGTIVANTQLIRNDIQWAQMVIMNENVTYLDFRNLYDAFNITQLVQRYAPVPDYIAELEGNLTFVETQVIVLQNLLQIIFAQILSIFYQMITIFSSQAVFYNQTTVLYNELLLADANLAIMNATLAYIIETLLYTINGVSSVGDTNINLTGVCGLQIYPSLVENGTLVVDLCALQAEVDGINANFTDAVLQFLAYTVMSNITVDTINYQYPIAGNINLIGNAPGTEVTPSLVAVNEVLVKNTGVVTINGVASDALLHNFDILATISSAIVVNSTGPHELTISAPNFPVISQMTASNDVVVASVGNDYTLANPITASEQPETATRMTCISDRTFYNAASVTWPDLTYLDLTPTIVQRPCRYNTETGSPANLSLINLNDPDSVFLINFRFYSTNYWRTIIADQRFSGFALKFLWCIQPFVPNATCTTSSIGYTEQQVDVYGFEPACFGSGADGTGIVDFCWITFQFSTMYVSSSANVPQYISFSVYNLGFLAPAATNVQLYGWKSEISVSRVL